MRSRGFTCFLLGMWLAGGIFLAFVTSQNVHGVAQTMSDPSGAASLRMKKLGVTDTEMLLRYEAARQNRYFLECWQNVELAVSLFLFLYLLFGTGENKIVLGFGLLLVVLVCVQRFLIIPEIVGLGRLLDFVPDAAYSQHRGRFRIMEATYLGTEIGKWIVQLGLAAYIIGRSSRSRRTLRNFGNKLNVVDKADYGHIDG